MKRTVSLVMAFGAAALLLAAGIALPVSPTEGGPLEPSIQNEVDHALTLGFRWLERVADGKGAENLPTNAPSAAVAVLAALTNGCDGVDATQVRAAAARLGVTNAVRESVALELVRTQRAEGHWLSAETNRADAVSRTADALRVLLSM